MAKIVDPLHMAVMKSKRSMDGYLWFYATCPTCGRLDRDRRKVPMIRVAENHRHDHMIEKEDA